MRRRTTLAVRGLATAAIRDRIASMSPLASASGLFR
jgi:hypothetical protein